MSTEKHIGESQMKGTPGKRFTLVIGDEAVKEKHIAPGAVTPSKLNDSTIEQIQSMINAAVTDLQNQINGIKYHGIAVSNQLGDDPYISVSQKYLTDCFNEVWDKIDEITGEQSRGIVMTVTPDYFISETGADVHIYATTAEIDGIFEHIAFYIDDAEEPFAEADEVSSFEYDLHIDAACIITCKAKIMGITYTQEHAIRHYNSFWLGAGSTYEDVMVPSNLIPIENDMRGAYDVTVAQNGQKFYVIVGDALTGFIRIDMNGFEIPMTKMPDDTLEGYAIYVSDNSYQVGTYNIDVNG